jgi:fimbrial isopeptide formation D2 family protein/uncharacterized repeat protein (TIGR01451 family)
VTTGTTIGFTITVSNSSATGTGTAFNAQLLDELPGGNSLPWIISPAYGGPGTCTIVAGTLGGSFTLTCSFGNLAPGGSAIVHVQAPTLAPPGSSAGTYNNSANAFANNEPLPGATSNTATIVVQPPPPPNLSVTKRADASPVTTGTTIGFTITVSNSSAAGTGTAFNAQLLDELPGGNSLPWIISPAYGGPGTCKIVQGPLGGSFTLSCSFGNLAPGASATVHVQAPTLAPPGSSAGTYNNSANAFADNEPLPGATSNTATIVVLPAMPPSITKSFGVATVPVNASTTLSFTITNPNTIALTGIGFTDTLPAGLVVATPNGLTGSCGAGSITAIAGSGAISLTGATLAASASCSFSLEITALTEGVKNNSTTPVTSNEGGNGNAATATIRVASPPTLTKVFTDSELQLHGPSNTTALSFTLTNPNTGTTLTGLAFTDTLPSGLTVSTPNSLTSSCGGTITATAGSNSISLSGATLAAGASCTFSVNVTGIAIGVQTNTTSTVTSNEAPPGAPATATTSVDDLFFFWFFAA